MWSRCRAKVKLAIGGSLALTYVLYALFTGGVVLQNMRWFGGQRNVVLAEGLRSDIWVNPNYAGGGIPFLGFYYATHLPCPLRIQIWDESKKFESIEVETVVVVYQSGMTRTFDLQWTRKLQAYTQVNSSSPGIIRTPMMMLSEETPPVIEFFSDCVATLSGFLVTDSGDRVPFKVVEAFRYESGLRVGSYWQQIANA